MFYQQNGRLYKKKINNNLCNVSLWLVFEEIDFEMRHRENGKFGIKVQIIIPTRCDLKIFRPSKRNFSKIYKMEDKLLNLLKHVIFYS